MINGPILAPGGSDARDVIAVLAEEPSANAGLIWDHYLRVWRGTTDRPERLPMDGRRDVLLQFARERSARAARSSVDSPLRERNERLRRALGAARVRSPGGSVGSGESRILRFRLEWRFAAGLGSVHPVENGFAFDHTSGVPYLSGSSVKGLCRAAARLDELDRSKIEHLFGPDRVTAADPGSQGTVRFFDALPETMPRLGLDIVNSHHRKYYSELADAPSRNQRERKRPPTLPRETDDPLPVYLLVVESGAVFNFPILACSAADADTIEQLLCLGLDWLGAGAKTAVGYGRFAALNNAARK